MKLPTLDDRIYDDYETYTPGRDSLYDEIEQLRPTSRRRAHRDPRARLTLLQAALLVAGCSVTTFLAVLLLLRSIFG